MWNECDKCYIPFNILFKNIPHRCIHSQPIPGNLLSIQKSDIPGQKSTSAILPLKYFYSAILRETSLWHLN